MNIRGERVLIFGDSLSSRGSTEQVNVTETPNRVSSSPGDLLASWLLAAGAQAARLDARVGRSAINFWDREAAAQLLAQDAAWKPTLVIVALGTNDIGRDVVKTTLAMAKLRDAFRQMGADVIAIGPPSFTRADLQNNSGTVVAMLQEVFGKRNVIDARPLSTDLIGSQFRTSDQVHFTREGAAVLAQRYAGAVMRLNNVREKLAKLKPLGIGLGATLGIGLVGFGLLWISKRRTKLLAGGDAVKMTLGAKQRSRLDRQTADEIREWMDNASKKQLYYTFETMEADDQSDKKFWLDTKLKVEGEPPDQALIHEILNDRVIRRPVILDVDEDVAVEGRHRLAAAIRGRLPVPIVILSAKRFKGARKFDPTKPLGMTKQERHHEIEEERADPVVDVASRAIVPFFGAGVRYVSVKKIFVDPRKLAETIIDVKEGRTSFSHGAPLEVSRLDSPRGAFYVMDGHHRLVELMQKGETSVPITISEKMPRIERTGGGYRDAVARKVRVTLDGVQPYTSEDFSERLQEAKANPRLFKATAERVKEAAQQIAREGGAWGGRKVFISDVAKRLGVSTKNIAGPLLIANNRGWLELARADLTAAMDEHKVRASEIESPMESRYHFVVVG